MAVYLVGFFVSCLVIAAVEKSPHWSVGYWFWSCAALLIPCLIAGLRADSIGTDVSWYVEPLYQLAERNVSLRDYFGSQWWQLWRYQGPADFEPGFVLLVWVATRLFGSLGGVLFCIQALTVVPVFWALTRWRSRLGSPVWLGMAVYYLLYFNSSLNLMRQWIAMAILLCAACYLVEHRGRPYFGLVLLAMLFHKTAVLGVLLWAIFSFLAKGKDSGVWRVVIVGVVGVAGLMLAGVASSLLVRMGFAQYAAYLGDVSFSANQLILRLPALVLLLACWRGASAVGPQLAALFVAFAALDIVFSQLGTASEQGTRIALFFGEYLILSLPLACATIRDWSNRIAFCVMTLGYLLMYWLVIYAVLGTSQTVPYVSALCS